MSTRKITVFSTKGQQRAEINTDVTVWGELKSLVEREGYDMDNLHATENITRHDLAHSQAALPEGDFTLFLRPKKTKSGCGSQKSSGSFDVEGKSFCELRDIVKENKEDADFMAHINSEGNYTRLNKEHLRSLIGSWEPASNSEAIVEEVAEESSIEELVENMSEARKVSYARELIQSTYDSTDDDDVADRCEIILDEIDGLIEYTGTDSQKEDDDYKLLEEAEDLMEGFE